MRGGQRPTWQSVPRKAFPRGEGGSRVSRKRETDEGNFTDFPGTSISCVSLRTSVVLRAANRNSNDCRWQSYHNLCSTGVAIPRSLRMPSYHACHCEEANRRRGHPFSPWLPLWGSCHEVTERVKAARSTLRGGSRAKAVPNCALRRGTLPRAKNMPLACFLNGLSSPMSIP